MKREREDEPKIYFVSFTEYVDDYKLRGQDTITTTYGFFTDTAAAEKFLLKEFNDILGDADDWLEKHEEFKYDKDGSFEDIQMIFDAYMQDYKSEYIPCAKYSYTYGCIDESILNKTQML